MEIQFADRELIVVEMLLLHRANGDRRAAKQLEAMVEFVWRRTTSDVDEDFFLTMLYSEFLEMRMRALNALKPIEELTGIPPAFLEDRDAGQEGA